MTDTKVKGSGNSRTLITVPNAPTLYPDHQTLMQKWSTEGIPVDVGPLLAIGCEIIGTVLNKENMLPDSVEKELWGSAANRTPAQALSRLRSLITTAQTTAEKGAYVETGSYTGTGVETAAKTLNLARTPKFIVVYVQDWATIEGSPDEVYLFVYPLANYIGGGGYFDQDSGRNFWITWGSKSVTFNVNPSVINSLNRNGRTYGYFAITQK